MGAISAILHGDSKAGKSTLAYTLPGPKLLLDAESAARWLPGVKIYWDPIAEAPPIPGQGRIKASDPTVYAVDWTCCVVQVTSWAVFLRAYEWLNVSEHPFKSVIIDSITEIQVTIKKQVTGGDVEQKLAYDGWNTMLVRMEELCRNFRDLTEHPTHPLNVAITAMTEFKDGKWRPFIQGSAAKKLPYFFDLIGYVYREKVVDAYDPSVPPRVAHKVLTGFDDNIISGERIGGRIPPIMEDLNFENVLREAFPEDYVTPAVSDSTPNQ
jgi:hypothetical protein